MLGLHWLTLDIALNLLRMIAVALLVAAVIGMRRDIRRAVGSGDRVVVKHPENKP